MSKNPSKNSFYSGITKYKEGIIIGMKVTLVISAIFMFILLANRGYAETDAQLLSVNCEQYKSYNDITSKANFTAGDVFFIVEGRVSDCHANIIKTSNRNFSDCWIILESSYANSTNPFTEDDIEDFNEGNVVGFTFTLKKFEKTGYLEDEFKLVCDNGVSNETLAIETLSFMIDPKYPELDIATKQQTKFTFIIAIITMLGLVLSNLYDLKNKTRKWKRGKHAVAVISVLVVLFLFVWALFFF